MIATAQAGETVDAICWRVLGRTAGVTEQVFELNPGLADLGAQLPGGTNVTLPDLAATALPARQIVKLWD
ncbi:tail protein X [Qipengyuania citrea]|uniref:tail protein X n=1 Tax=Qipengyuania citrea TaxID=225971 RepID=UPI00209ED290|nr:tail protein X [Qipengyuania citrea]MCP2016834.1 phage tail protein X [Qipengyuania citrea]